MQWVNSTLLYGLKKCLNEAFTVFIPYGYPRTPDIQLFYVSKWIIRMTHSFIVNYHYRADCCKIFWPLWPPEDE